MTNNIRIIEPSKGDGAMVLVIGTSQIGRVVAEMIATHEGSRAVQLVSEEPGKEAVDGYPVLGSLADLSVILSSLGAQRVEAVVALDSPALAAEVVHQLVEAGVSVSGVRDTTAYISDKAMVGAGACILANVTLCPGAVVGKNAIIGIGAVIGCDANVEDFARIPDGAHITAGMTVTE